MDGLHEEKEPSFDLESAVADLGKDLFGKLQRSLTMITILTAITLVMLLGLLLSLTALSLTRLLWWLTSPLRKLPKPLRRRQ